MAGTALISGQQRVGVNGRPYPNARAYFYEADTLTPINTFKDYGLGTPHPWPVQADAYGVFPYIFIDEAEEFYRVRITTAAGVTLSDLATLPVIGPSGGGGGSEVPVDPDALLKTGDAIWVPKSGARSGFVRYNGRTIGSATSGASERANLDCEALFLDQWAAFSNTLCPVSGGRGVSAAADWAANKTLTLLDMRNKGPFGLDDMGNSAASGFSGITFGTGDATTPGSSLGAATHILSEAQLPSVTKNIPAQNPTLTFDRSNGFASGSGITGVTSLSKSGGSQGPVETNDDASPGSISFGSGAAHPQMPPGMLGTWYVKL